MPLCAQPASTTAWHDGSFHVNTARVVSESDIVLGRPNTEATEALPLGTTAYRRLNTVQNRPSAR
jgi:hypothetical protein